MRLYFKVKNAAEFEAAVRLAKLYGCARPFIPNIGKVFRIYGYERLFVGVNDDHMQWTRIEPLLQEDGYKLSSLYPVSEYLKILKNEASRLAKEMGIPLTQKKGGQVPFCSITMRALNK